MLNIFLYLLCGAIFTLIWAKCENQLSIKMVALSLTVWPALVLAIILDALNGDNIILWKGKP